ncbi:hypothetical protein C3941_04905 [Kaistia algarum]|uniref:DUF4424 domain-containing protein n=1 Tax=Kaistia algarum TaxID=2083279 RepID=UPI000CE7535E|nr:DUF4424 domain-containing protein [Kaistia algarum]MCX5515980.1 DUF4424 domain-containing protein [Kaistia algarum]PPE80663.1 hypothetical protein C3941_04905 [Kaistia algarum]
MRAAPFALAACLLAAPAFANDSTAELGAGGLAYVTTEAVQMKSEDLFISMDEVRVRYAFENVSDQDVTSLVAFPMPDIKGDVDFMESVPVDDPLNFLGFRTTVDGQPVEASVQQRVTSLGIDQTAYLTSLGIPLAPQNPATRAALDKLPPEKWEELIHLGLVAVDEFDQGQGWEKHLAPMWLLQTAYYWQQTFPAKKTLIVEHIYKPSVGMTSGVTFASPESRKEAFFQDYERKYCIDKAFLAATDKVMGQGSGSDYMMEHRLDYILTTAANWAGSISKFHLTVDKGAAANLVSFCGDGVKKTGPTTFELSADDYYPEKDLHILILARPETTP